MRDHRRIIAFQEADALVVAVYRWTDTFPADERYVLKSQIRRTAVSIAANIVEGAARSSHGEYVNHLNFALGSAAELSYLVGLAVRIYPSLARSGNELPTADVIKLLVKLIDRLQSDGPKTGPARAQRAPAKSLEPRA